MNMQRFMVVRVELKDKTEEYKYCWHSFFFAKIGNNFITSKQSNEIAKKFELQIQLTQSPFNYNYNY